jgi:uncharacterized protein
MNVCVILSAIALLLSFSSSASEEKLHAGQPVKALLITGGCCHNYEFQAKALTNTLAKYADVQWKIVNEGGRGTRAEIDLYNDPNWAQPYDVVVHNECFADTKDADYIRKITAAHKNGKPAVVIHCAMHTYRSAELDDWRQFLGVTSKHHEHMSRYPVQVTLRGHPIMRTFPETWTTPMDELYIVEKVWPSTTVLATSKSERTGKEHAVFWVNDYHGTKVFGTTYGHSDDTFRDPVFLEIVSRGLLWAAGKLQ